MDTLQFTITDITNSGNNLVFKTTNNQKIKKVFEIFSERNNKLYSKYEYNGDLIDNYDLTVEQIGIINNDIILAY